MGTETLPSACYILSCYILIKNIYTLWGLKRFLLSVTYFPTNASFCLLHTFRRALPSACYILSDEDQEYIHFMGSETHPSACYILSDESTLSLLPVTYFPTNQACYILSDDSSIPLTLRVTLVILIKNIYTFTCYILSDESSIPYTRRVKVTGISFGMKLKKNRRDFIRNIHHMTCSLA